MQARSAVVCLSGLMGVILLAFDMRGIERSKEPELPLGRQLASGQYIFVKDTSRLVARYDGGDLLPVGHLDESGAFIPKEEYPGVPNPAGCCLGLVHHYIKEGLFLVAVIADLYDAPRPWLGFDRVEEPVYEYQDGKLIFGKLVVPTYDWQLNCWVIGPEFQPSGSRTPVDLEFYLATYDPQKSPRIYNLPGRIVRIRQVPPDDPYFGLPYRYEPRPKRMVGWRTRNRLYVGWLNPDGTFRRALDVPGRILASLDVSDFFGPERTRGHSVCTVDWAGVRDLDINKHWYTDREIWDCWMASGWLRFVYIINEGPREPVYEFRDGLLVKGWLDEYGRFHPYANEPMITLHEYLADYDPQRSVPIYNLPGRIIPTNWDDFQYDDPYERETYQCVLRSYMRSRGFLDIDVAVEPE